MQNICSSDYQRLMEQLKEDIMEGTTLKRPDLSRRFYINTDWYKDGMGAVIIQEDDSVEARKEGIKKRTLKNVNLTSPWK